MGTCGYPTVGNSPTTARYPRPDGGRVEVVAAAAKLLGDMEAMGTHIGLDPNQSTVPD